MTPRKKAFPKKLLSQEKKVKKKSFKEQLKDYCLNVERQYNAMKDLDNYKFNYENCKTCNSCMDTKGCKGIGYCVKYINQAFYSEVK